MTTTTTVDEVLELYERWGHEHYDEALAQLDHALQTAAHALQAQAADPLIAAALLHDVGHLLDLRGDPPAPHQKVGPGYLGQLFPAEVTQPIALHVAAKRYLCAVEPAYLTCLSAGSVRSLQRQGGPLPDAAAVADFESRPGWADAVALRRWDDAGKVDGAAVPGLAHYEPLLRSLACGS